MDGLVNKALVDVLRARAGSEGYARIAQEVGLNGTPFAAGTLYPDELTFRLVHAGADVLGLSSDAVLELLGEHWVGFAIGEGYGRFLTTAGRTFRDVLLNLDRMHEKISSIYPHLQQPSFWCTDSTDESLVLHYSSVRRGLAPLVVGIVRGLATMHHTRVEVTPRRLRDDGALHDEFLVRILAA
jgi:heme-NO-binding protein